MRTIKLDDYEIEVIYEALTQYYFRQSDQGIPTGIVEDIRERLKPIAERYKERKQKGGAV